MTKQEQILKEKIDKALELQEQGIVRQEIYKMVGYASLDSLTKAFKKFGYTYCKEEKKYIHRDLMSNTGSNTDSNTSSNTPKMDITLVEKKEMQVPVQSEVLDLLDQEKDTLKDMIAWYKQYSNTSNTSNTFIKIELPISENVMISTRSNKVVWEQFKIFAKNNSANFKMGDLVAQAFKEYMEKYQ